MTDPATPTPLRALPPEVDDLLDLFGTPCRCTQSFECSPHKARKELRTHIATLTRDCERMRAERDEALRWAVDQTKDSSCLYYGDLVDKINAELARLEAKPATGEGQPR